MFYGVFETLARPLLTPDSIPELGIEPFRLQLFGIRVTWPAQRVLQRAMITNEFAVGIIDSTDVCMFVVPIYV